ncbi:hypothetical protein EDEG_02690 [Edhazardia aedis USNM 41457]|uniref:Uncharacterized protein n=1 Tax=Edhazardia aedis (strain USNM 41457) TaxID=1003232 RepID=J9DJX9_EDHAE|nr:hypothetical protein EDEG_02690 [Edhazardia aedis USNM 41457]|eukprot:EJW02925.1 hypothetical protein EDEG_02690 [Edhazardia aedis USNM 41457]
MYLLIANIITVWSSKNVIEEPGSHLYEYLKNSTQVRIDEPPPVDKDRTLCFPVINSVKDTIMIDDAKRSDSNALQNSSKIFDHSETIPKKTFGSNVYSYATKDTVSDILNTNKNAKNKNFLNNKDDNKCSAEENELNAEVINKESIMCNGLYKDILCDYMSRVHGVDSQKDTHIDTTNKAVSGDIAKSSMKIYVDSNYGQTDIHAEQNEPVKINLANDPVFPDNIILKKPEIWNPMNLYPCAGSSKRYNENIQIPSCDHQNILNHQVISDKNTRKRKISSSKATLCDSSSTNDTTKTKKTDSCTILSQINSENHLFPQNINYLETARFDNSGRNYSIPFGSEISTKSLRDPNFSRYFDQKNLSLQKSDFQEYKNNIDYIHYKNMKQFYLERANKAKAEINYILSKTSILNEQSQFFPIFYNFDSSAQQLSSENNQEMNRVVVGTHNDLNLQQENSRMQGQFVLHDNNKQIFDKIDVKNLQKDLIQSNSQQNTDLSMNQEKTIDRNSLSESLSLQKNKQNSDSIREFNEINSEPNGESSNSEKSSDIEIIEEYKNLRTSTPIQTAYRFLFEIFPDSEKSFNTFDFDLTEFLNQKLQQFDADKRVIMDQANKTTELIEKIDMNSHVIGKLPEVYIQILKIFIVSENFEKNIVQMRPFWILTSVFYPEIAGLVNMFVNDYHELLGLNSMRTKLFTYIGNHRSIQNPTIYVQTKRKAEKFNKKAYEKIYNKKIKKSRSLSESLDTFFNKMKMLITNLVKDESIKQKLYTFLQYENFKQKIEFHNFFRFAPYLKKNNMTYSFFNVVISLPNQFVNESKKIFYFKICNILEFYKISTEGTFFYELMRCNFVFDIKKQLRKCLETHIDILLANLIIKTKNSSQYILKGTITTLNTSSCNIYVRQTLYGIYLEHILNNLTDRLDLIFGKTPGCKENIEVHVIKAEKTVHTLQIKKDKKIYKEFKFDSNKTLMSSLSKIFFPLCFVQASC